jgi:drug/metabolite transporter (DMT)-like permease
MFAWSPDGTPPPTVPAVDRRPALGYTLAATAAAMWALNGNLARFVLEDGVSAAHLSALRSGVSFLLLLAFVALTRRQDLRIARRHLPLLAWLGIAGLAGVHATYFLAIERLDIGVALVIQYLGPLLILLWLRVVHGRRLPALLWGAVALSLAGAFMVVEAYDASRLDGLGLLAAAGAAITFAVYLVAAERAGRRHLPHTTLVYAFGFATLFWLVVRPPWTFPTAPFEAEPVNVLHAAGVVAIGTLIPFVLIVTALRHIPAPRAAVVSTLEPVLAALIAWPVHAQALGVPQIAGGLLVLGAVVAVQSRRPQLDAEAAPP